ERGVASARAEIVVEAGLVVPKAQLHVERRDRREDQPRVAVAPAQRQRPASVASAGSLGLTDTVGPTGSRKFGVPPVAELLALGLARAIEGDLEQRARIGQAQIDLAAQA